VDASGLLVSSRGDRVEIVRADGTRHEFANGGEHSVWAVAVDEARRGLAIGGRFGAQRWDAAGVRDTACRGDRSPFVVDWQADTLVGDASCHLATSRRPRGVEEPFAVSDDARFLVESDGTFVDRATSRRVPLDEVGELYCRGHDEGCDGAVTFGPRGAALVLELFNVDVDEDSLLVHETTTGRRLASLPYGAAFAFAPDGAWLTYARTRTLHVLDLAGPDHATRDARPRGRGRRGVRPERGRARRLSRWPLDRLDAGQPASRARGLRRRRPRHRGCDDRGRDRARAALVRLGLTAGDPYGARDPDPRRGQRHRFAHAPGGARHALGRVLGASAALDPRRSERRLRGGRSRPVRSG
jgi:hypothetical protein